MQPIGATTNLAIRDFMALVFHEIEVGKERLTDEQIEELVRQEFVGTEVISSLDDLSAISSTSRIRNWRSEFNRGLWPIKPEYFSFRYGPDPDDPSVLVPINRHGNPLTLEQFKKQSKPRKVTYARSDKVVK